LAIVLSVLLRFTDLLLPLLVVDAEFFFYDLLL
jgi:hypothetical protein